MPKRLAFLVALALPVAAPAQQPANPAAACPAGTHYATIRHNRIKPGQWPAFEAAVAAHNAWYKTHASATVTSLVRLLPPAIGADSSTAEAVTITRYADAAPPAHDAGYADFTARYRASSDLKDEMRVCLPPLG